MLLNHSSLFDTSRMLAKDMFADELIQVFSKKKGNYLGVVRLGEQFDFCEQDEITAPEPVKKYINQLNLF